MYLCTEKYICALEIYSCNEKHISALKNMPVY